MSETIEEKIPLYTKIIFYISFSSVLWNIIDFMTLWLTVGIDDERLAFFIILICFAPMSLMVFGVIFLKSATKLTVKDEIVIVKQVLRKPVIIQLKDIYKIDTWGDVKYNRHFYVLKSKEKDFNTSLISTRFGKKSLDVFMEELKLRVDKAKMVERKSNYKIGD